MKICKTQAWSEGLYESTAQLLKQYHLSNEGCYQVVIPALFQKHLPEASARWELFKGTLNHYFFFPDLTVIYIP